MKRTIVIVLTAVIAVVGSTRVCAQSAQEADRLFADGRYGKALAAYQALQKGSPASPLYKYRLGRCHYELGHYEEAAKWLDAAGERYPLRNYYLGISLLRAYRFDEAEEALQNYLDGSSPTPELAADAERQLPRCRLGKRLMSHVEDIIVVDTIGMSREAFMNQLNTLLPARCGIRGMSVADGAASYCVGDREECRRRFVTLTNGDSTQLYTEEKLLEGYSDPQKLSDKINANRNTNFPFVMKDGMTLYFAAEGEGSMGGYDLFKTRYNLSTDDYVTPDNLGFPFNSPMNDYLLAVDETARIGWFATENGAGPGRVMFYGFVYEEESTFLRNLPQDELILRASLRKLNWGERPDRAEGTEGEQKADAGHPQFSFDLGNGTACHRPEDFRDSTARADYEAYAKDLETYLQLRRQLEELRTAYAQGDADRRQELSGQIMELEGQTEQLRQSTERQKARIRRMELQFRQQEHEL